MLRFWMAGLLGASLVSAAPITFDFTSSGGTNAGSSYGNTRTYSSGGLTLVVSAFGATGSGGTLQTARLGQYSGYGLGVCNQNEGVNCGSPAHQVDSSGADDYVLFSFFAGSTPIALDPISVTVMTFGDGLSDSGCPGDCADTDMTYFLRTTSNAFNLAGSTPTAQSFSAGVTLDGPFTSSSVTHLIGGSTSAFNLLVAAGPTGNNDFFKIQSLTVDLTPPGDESVPEPATLALMGAALVGLGIARRAKKA